MSPLRGMDGSELEAARTLTLGVPSAADAKVAGEEDTESESEGKVGLRRRASSGNKVSSAAGLAMVERRRKRAPTSTAGAGAKRARSDLTEELLVGRRGTTSLVAAGAADPSVALGGGHLGKGRGAGAVKEGSRVVGGQEGPEGAPFPDRLHSLSFIAMRSSLCFPCTLCHEEMDTTVGLWMHAMKVHPEISIPWASMAQASVDVSDRARRGPQALVGSSTHEFLTPRMNPTVAQNVSMNGVPCLPTFSVPGPLLQTGLVGTTTVVPTAPGRSRAQLMQDSSVVLPMGVVSNPAMPPPPSAARRGRPPGSGALRSNPNQQGHKELFVCVDGVGYAGCGRNFTSRSGLWVHVRSVHKGIKHICKVCNKIFPFSSGLSQHIESVHLGVRRARMGKTCPECGNVLKGSLKKHMASQHPHILVDVLRESRDGGSESPSSESGSGGEDDGSTKRSPHGPLVREPLPGAVKEESGGGGGL